MTSLLPPNATLLEQGIEAAIARIAAVPVPLRDLWSADACPVALLPWLAWALSVDTWDAAWPESIKRARIREAIPIQRAKGTVRSIHDIVAVFGGAIALREWWQLTPPGDPHTFDLVLSLASYDGVPSAMLVETVIGEIARTKPLRSHFTFTLAIAGAGAIGMTGAARAAVFARLTTAAPAA